MIIRYIVSGIGIFVLALLFTVYTFIYRSELSAISAIICWILLIIIYCNYKYDVKD